MTRGGIFPGRWCARAAALVVCAACIAESRAWSADAKSVDELLQESLPFRAALHRDPTLDAPFDRLLSLFSKAGCLDQLKRIYSDHLQQYPDDPNARIVLMRLLVAHYPAKALQRVEKACAANPNDAYLHFLCFRALQSLNMQRDLDELDAAIALASAPRKREWVELFVPMAVARGRRDLAVKHLASLLGAAGDSCDERMYLAGLMMRHGFHDLASRTLAGVAPPASAEQFVDLELARARAEVGADEAAQAGRRLDALLDKLAVDHWRRSEILRRRASLVTSAEERASMVERARAALAQAAVASRQREAAALDLAHLLASFERRREALDVLLEEGENDPRSRMIEARTLALFDLLRDERGKVAYLSKRITATPGEGDESPPRADLRMMRVKSLFTIGRLDEAAGELDDILGQLTDDDRADQRLSVARYLCASGLLREAAGQFARAIEVLPERLDVRRELAEVYVKLGAPRDAARVLNVEDSGNAKLEHLLDAVHFMTKAGSHHKACELLQEAAASHPSSLEVRTLLVTVLEKLGRETEGVKVALASRDLADTPSRYRLWLETAARVNEAADDLDFFLDEERCRLDTERQTWDENALGRFEVFCDVAGGNYSAPAVAALIQEYLDRGAPPQVSIVLRRRLATLFETVPAGGPNLAELLKRLIEEDPEHADEYTARLALHQAADQGGHIADALENIDVGRITSPALLTRLTAAAENLQMTPLVKRTLERSLEINPTSRKLWQKILHLYASQGDEEKLRGTAVKLLAGVERVELDAATKNALRSMVVDSCWRSVAVFIAEKNESTLSDALSLLDIAQQMSLPLRDAPAPTDSETVTYAHGEAEFLWIGWARAYVLGVLDRPRECAEAMAEFKRWGEILASREGRQTEEEAEKKAHGEVGDSSEPVAEPQPIAQLVIFPDGMSLSLAEAERSLDRAIRNGKAAFKTRGMQRHGLPSAAVVPLAAAPATAAPRGPASCFAAEWVFDLPAARDVVRIVALDVTRALICDNRGDLYCIDSLTGKLRWSRNGAAQALYTLRTGQRYGYDESGVVMPSEILFDGEDGVIIARADSVSRIGIDRGEVIWEGVTVRPKTRAHAGSPNISLVRGERTVVAWDPATSTLHEFDIRSGRLLRQAELRHSSSASLTPVSCGAHASQGRLVVYGSTSAVLDADTWELLWSASTDGVRVMPIALDPPKPAGDAGTIGPCRPVVVGGSFKAAQARERRLVDYYAGSADVLVEETEFLLVGPVGKWAEAGGCASRLAYLHGSDLILASDQQLYVTDADVMIGGRSARVGGTLVGITRRRAVYAQRSDITVVDLRTFAESHIDISVVTSGGWEDSVEALTDGTCLYVTGDKGLARYNIHTGEASEAMPWPACARGEEEARLVTGGSNLRGNMVHSADGVQACIPPRIAAGHRVLYVAPTPGRVVAFVEGDRKQHVAARSDTEPERPR
jgi:tetratricopeptide (TPR) repeat protein